MDEANVTHHVCTGSCGGVSPTAGTCQAPECNNHGQSLKACDCTDGSHGSGMSEGDSNTTPQM